MQKSSLILLIFCGITAKTPAQTIAVDMGKVDEVEFVGLTSTTPQQIFTEVSACADSFCLNSDGSFKIHCNVCLEKTLTFPEIHAVTRFKQNKRLGVIVTLVELNRAHLLDYRKLPSDTAADRNEWRDLISSLDHSDMWLQSAIQTYSILYENRSPVQVDSIIHELNGQGYDGDAMKNNWQLIAKHGTDTDIDAAIATLNTDANPRNRAAAILILLNASDDPRLMATLLDLLRLDTSDVETNHIGMVLKSYSQSKRTFQLTRDVHPSLKALLAGTNIKHFRTLLSFLAGRCTIDDVTRDLILRHGRHLITAHLKSESCGEKTRKQLEKITGTSFADPEECVTFIDGYQ